LIVSIHIPKTAGSSFKQLLEETNKSISYSYDQLPLLQRFYNKEVKKVSVDNESDILHGHFIADSVSDIRSLDLQYIVWLRNPVERVVSHYFYWQRNPNINQPICKKIMEGLTLKEFSQIESMRNVQSFFLGQVPLKQFSFIGIQEKFQDSISKFNTIFDLNIKNDAFVNYNSQIKNQSYLELIGKDLYKFIESQNKLDEELYLEAFKLMGYKSDS